MRQLPFRSIIVRRHVVLGAQMALQSPEFLAVFETDQKVGRDRLLDRHGRFFLLFDYSRWLPCCKLGQCVVDGRDDLGQIA